MDEKKKREEQRRIKTYREFGRCNRWEETLRTLRDTWRTSAVVCAGSNNSVGASYFNGKADGVEDLIERIRNSSTRTRTSKRGHEEEVEVI